MVSRTAIAGIVIAEFMDERAVAWRAARHAFI
jgi:hypothetical protein